MTTSAAIRTSDDYLTRFYPVVCRMAASKFKADITLINDAVSVAWEIYSAANSDVTPGNVGYYAVKTVASRRWMQGSTRCPSSVTQTAEQPTLYHFDFDDYYAAHQNPARIAALRIDFSEWLHSLTHRQQDLVKMLASGESTADAAQKLGCTAGNISQYRKRLADSWYAYQA
jgi:DNA-binding NarL/FixJ family response regulator